MLALLVFALSLARFVHSHPIFPLQIQADVEITAHLIPPDSDYPPRVRRMKIFYDYVNKRARADIEAGYEAEKTYIRLYNDKKEYMVRGPPINDCSRAYLGEKMPFPDLGDSSLEGTIYIRGIFCDHFLQRFYDTTVRFYMDHETGIPVRLTVLSYDNEGSTEVEVLSYDYFDVEVGEPDARYFQLPDEYEHSTCANQIGGFPYLHVFHYFVRF
mmetsp:Transcript_20015/g.28745  ORF Transcript_20015/g.28745 Transcript_20015/m.28745 type:complete len:214 (+) Transcript_20015:50-691(+)